MRDEMTFVEQVHRDLRDVRWPEPAEIRARARRRSRRTALTAAVAVLVVISGSAVAVGEWAGRKDAPPAPMAATAVSPTTAAPADIPQDALLAPADLPLTTAVQLGEPGLMEPVRVDPVLESCGRERGVPSAAPTSRYSRSQTLLFAPVSPVTRGPALTQEVYRVQPGQGRLVFGLVGLLLNACAEWQLTKSTLLDGRPVATIQTHRWETPISGFAGDDSVMLRHVSMPSRLRASGRAAAADEGVEVTMVVQVGDLVTVIALSPGTLQDTVAGTRPGGLSSADLQTLGRTAARRMCASANTGC
ncbi:hypothetical protein V6U77_06860 [Micromonospora sp. CPCC 205546]|uniref:hypothetical protein n=1 Tax=Micromonospora sp. CPCC 205546 TaxID=3122397 RepID=UPI002FEEF39F